MCSRQRHHPRRMASMALVEGLETSLALRFWLKVRAIFLDDVVFN